MLLEKENHTLPRKNRTIIQIFYSNNSRQASKQATEEDQQGSYPSAISNTSKLSDWKRIK